MNNTFICATRFDENKKCSYVINLTIESEKPVFINDTGELILSAEMLQNIMAYLSVEESIHDFAEHVVLDFTSLYVSASVIKGPHTFRVAANRVAKKFNCEPNELRVEQFGFTVIRHNKAEQLPFSIR